MRRVLVLLLLAPCFACMPTAPADLYGIWSNLDAGTLRVLEFGDDLGVAELDGVEPDFQIYNYAEGGDPVVVQAGWYEIETIEAEVADPILNPDPDEGGTFLVVHATIGDAGMVGDFANKVVAWSASKLTLESDTAENGQREFQKVRELP